MNFGGSTDEREMSMTVISSVCKFEDAQTQTRGPVVVKRRRLGLLS